MIDENIPVEDRIKTELNREEIWMVVDAIKFYVARSTHEQVEKINKTNLKICDNDPLSKHCSYLGEWGEPVYDRIIEKLTKQSNIISLIEEYEKDEV